MIIPWRVWITMIIPWRVWITMIIPCHSMIVMFDHGCQPGPDIQDIQIETIFMGDFSVYQSFPCSKLYFFYLIIHFQPHISVPELFRSSRTEETVCLWGSRWFERTWLLYSQIVSFHWLNKEYINQASNQIVTWHILNNTSVHTNS